MVYVEFFFGGITSKGYPLKIFVKNVARGNAVQIFSNFPAKSLSIYRANFFDDTFVINLISIN